MVLQVDAAGTPQDWMTLQDAAVAITNKNVAWMYGDPIATLHGGISRLSGLRSTLDIPPILATRSVSNYNLAEGVPSLNNHKLFARDRHVCAYCGGIYRHAELTREHIQPVSRGGLDVWKNVVTNCKPCNGSKGNKTLKESGLSLLYLPYEPNWFENFLLRRGGRKILADQMEFLVGRLPSHSRLLLS